MFEAIALNEKGEPRHPAIYRRVYYTSDGGLAQDPAESLYRLAVGKLEYDRAQKGEPDPDDEPKPKAEATPKKAEPKPEAEAERRGAQRVIEQVSKNANRLKGIRRVPNAGEPQRMSRQQLDELMDGNPEAYEALMARNPGLQRFHLGG